MGTTVAGLQESKTKTNCRSHSSPQPQFGNKTKMRTEKKGELQSSVKKEETKENAKTLEITKPKLQPVAEKPSESKVFIMIALSLFLILFGCCTNYFFLELMVREDRSCASFASFFQFVFIVLEGVSFQLDFKNIKSMFTGAAKEFRILKTRKLPMSYHLFLVVIFYSQAWTSSLPMSFGISMTLHAIFRSGTLVMV